MEQLLKQVYDSFKRHKIIGTILIILAAVCSFYQAGMNLGEIIYVLTH